MDPIEAGREKSRELKEELRDHLQKWYEVHQDNAALIAALGELTAEAALTHVGKFRTVEFFHELCRVVLRRKFVHPEDVVDESPTSH